MNKQSLIRFAALSANLKTYGVTYDELFTLLRCEKQLNRWQVAQCNGDVSQDETTGQWYRHYERGSSRPFQTVKTTDSSASAIRRAQKIAFAHGLTAFEQDDCRGCSLYIIRPGDVEAGQDVSACYHRGLAIYI